MEETPFIAENNALVTSTRIVLAGKTYATRNIGSVGISVMKPRRLLPILLLIIGLVACLRDAIPIGVVLVLASALWLFISKATWQLKLMAGGGEVLALQSNDGPYIQRVHDAIASAISVR